MISNGRKKGILNKRILESTTEPAAIMKITEEVFGMNLKTKGDHRNAAIYLVRRYSGLTNEETGKLFGGMHYTAVSRLCKKFSEQIAADKKLNEKIKAILSRIKA
jgi:chromosomal replication initiation ATPase DnaA